MSRATRIAGMTIVELLAVVAIIGVLVALLLPAVQAVRESSRKTTCTNNLKQICLATLQYSNDNAGRLPASWRVVRDENGKPAANAYYHFYIRSFSWRATILPFVGEQALYDRLDFSTTPIADKNLPLVVQTLSLFQCPSTVDSPRTVFKQYPDPEVQMGANDYVHVFFVGQNETDSVITISAKQLPGAWYGRATFTRATIDPNFVSADQSVEARGGAPLNFVSDGMSKTILCAEKAGYPTTYHDGQVIQPTPWGEGVWAAGEMGGFGRARVDLCNFPSIYSFHPSCAHAGMCDGAVKLLSDDTDPEIVVALCSRSGGETGQR